MKKRKISAVLLIFCILVGSLSGCSSEFFSELWEKITGKEVTAAQEEQDAEDDDTEEEDTEDEEIEDHGFVDKEYPELTEDEYDKTVQSVEELRQNMQVYVEDGAIPDEELSEVVAEVENTMDSMMDSGEVDGYEITDTGVAIQYSNGMKVFIDLMKTEDTWAGGGTSSLNDVVSIMDAAAPGYRKIALIQPYRDEDDCDDMEDACRNISEAYDNFELEIIRDVSLQAVSELDKYDIVLWEGHSFYRKDSSVVLFTSQQADYAFYQKHHEAGDRGLWYTTNVFDESMDARVAVDYKFFLDTYESGSMDGMLVFLTLCNTMTDNTLAHVLLGKGVDVIVGYNSTVAFAYGHKMAKTIFEELSKGNTLKQGVTKAKEEHGEKDYTYSDWKTLIFDTGNYEFKSKVNTYIRVVGDENYTVPETMRQRSCALDMAGVPYEAIEYIWDECYFFENDFGGWFAQCSTDYFAADFFYDDSEEGDKDAVASKFNVYDYNYSNPSGNHIPITKEIFTGMTDIQVENVVNNDEYYEFTSDMTSDGETMYHERQITYEEDGVLYTIGLIFIDDCENLILQGAGITYEEID